MAVPEIAPVVVFNVKPVAVVNAAPDTFKATVFEIPPVIVGVKAILA